VTDIALSLKPERKPQQTVGSAQIALQFVQKTQDSRQFLPELNDLLKAITTHGGIDQLTYTHPTYYQSPIELSEIIRSYYIREQLHILYTNIEMLVKTVPSSN